MNRIMWEYMTEIRKALTAPELNQLGAVGWELVAMVAFRGGMMHGDEYIRYVFKRPDIKN